jgi:hypothetical protein
MVSAVVTVGFSPAHRQPRLVFNATSASRCREEPTVKKALTVATRYLLPAFLFIGVD